jgi:hyperosmotically inducible protein
MFPGSRRAKSWLCLCLLVAVALPLWGQQPDPERRPLGATPSSAERIAREVRHELLLLSHYTLFDFLAFQVEGNKVTLLGYAVEPILKSDAEDAVKGVEGVEAVDNQIEVLPPSSMDDRLRRAVYRAIYGFGGLSRYALGASPSIHIIVKNGNLILEGSVDSSLDRNLAGLRANTVSGIFSITNNLVVPDSPAGGEAKQ